MTHDEEDELLKLVRETHALAVSQLELASEARESAESLLEVAREQLEIAREYKVQVGDPLHEFIVAAIIMTKVVAWVCGITLALVGLREAWEQFVVRRYK